ncbi:MAG: NAD(P)H-quinone oxidoreductase [Rhodospirillaceae bacterium]
MRLPETMTCIEIAEPGGPDQLKPTTRPRPAPGKGEVLIRVQAAGVNRPDVVQRQGHYAPPEGVTAIPGLEVAGEVAAVGAGVKGWTVGDTLCALVAGGGYGEYVTAPQEQCLPVPKGLTMVEAAALPETFFTVWTNLYERAALQPGETLLVHGGTSGIGTTAIQVASKLGARVMATAGSAEKCQVCLDLGAKKSVNYREEDFVPAARDFGGGRGVNVILDMVGGDYIERNIKSLASGGRLVNIAFMGGPKATVNFMPVMLKRLTLTGSTLRSQPVSSKARIARAVRETVWPLIEKGEIKPVIYKTFPLDQAAEAHELMESNRHIGKIVFDLKSAEKRRNSQKPNRFL